MTDLIFGKGVYIWKPDRIAGRKLDAFGARLQEAGVQSAAIRVCDGARVLGGLNKLTAALRQRGIRVGAWGSVRLNRVPRKESRALLQACDRYRPEFYIIRAEAQAEGRHANTRMFLDSLRSRLSAVPLGLNFPSDIARHPAFPWQEFRGAVDFLCPDIQLRGVDPVGQLIARQHALAAHSEAADIPMLALVAVPPSGKGGKPSPAQLSAFLSAADTDPFVHGVFMCVADAAAMKTPTWDAFAAHEWKGAGHQAALQPLGWAKVKAPGGLWIRRSPRGETVGGLAQGELTPIWTVTETRWAALNQAADQWIFIGDPDSVSTTLDGSAARALPSTGLELYQARVATRRGLNVREAARGRVVRVLAVDSVVRVYEDKDGWARISPGQGEWVNAAFLGRITG